MRWGGQRKVALSDLCWHVLNILIDCSLASKDAAFAQLKITERACSVPAAAAQAH
jgi:hypothetical protein